MKKLFIPVEYKYKINHSELAEISRILPKNIAIVYSVQYSSLAGKLRKELSKKHKVLGFFQVLGCTKPHLSDEIEAVLVVSDGKFHAISLAYGTKKTVYLFERGRLIKLSEKEINSFERKRKASYVNFLNSYSAGVLISTKPGQQKLSKALNLRKKFKDKRLYFFISNDINLNEIENFNLNSWINTACPRLDMDSKVINISGL